MSNSNSESGILNQYKIFKNVLRAISSINIKRVISALTDESNVDDAYLLSQLDKVFNLISIPEVKSNLKEFFNDPSLAKFNFSEKLKKNNAVEELKKMIREEDCLNQLKKYFANLKSNLNGIESQKFNSSIKNELEQLVQDTQQTKNTRWQQAQYDLNGGPFMLGLLIGRLLAIIMMYICKASGLEVNSEYNDSVVNSNDTTRFNPFSKRMEPIPSH